jgi:hypothetical protein
MRRDYVCQLDWRHKRLEEFEQASMGMCGQEYVQREQLVDVEQIWALWMQIIAS